MPDVVLPGVLVIVGVVLVVVDVNGVDEMGVTVVVAGDIVDTVG